MGKSMMTLAHQLLTRLSAMNQPEPLQERTMVTRYGALIDLAEPREARDLWNTYAYRQQETSKLLRGWRFLKRLWGINAPTEADCLIIRGPQRVVAHALREVRLATLQEEVGGRDKYDKLVKAYFAYVEHVLEDRSLVTRILFETGPRAMVSFQATNTVTKTILSRRLVPGAAQRGVLKADDDSLIVYLDWTPKANLGDEPEPRPVANKAPAVA